MDYLPRRHCVPVIYARGTHYDVGFDVGRTFSGLIQDLLKNLKTLNEEYLPLYATSTGKAIYDATYEAVKSRYPQYLAEMQGYADGAGVPFHKLFLLQMDDILTNAAANVTTNNKATGCSSICLNEPHHKILGHTEDALAPVLNHYYILSAHIIADGPQGVCNVKEEKFMSLCYAGHLPGYTMGNNHHGLVYSINTLSARRCLGAKLPRTILTRALLTAKSYNDVLKILSDDGCGAGDGCSINLTFLNDSEQKFFNIEMGPALGTCKSPLDVTSASKGEFLVHCNRYLRLKIPETDGLIIDSSNARLETLSKYRPKTKKDVEQMLSDQTGTEFRVFQEFGPDDYVKTIATGIFDIDNKTWSIYSDKASDNKPIVELPLLPIVSDKIIC